MAADNKGNEMLESVKKEAVAAITAAAGKDPVMVDSAMECIYRLIEDFGKSADKISENIHVIRDIEEDGQMFDFWMFCKYGPRHTGQTITAIVMK